MKDFNEIRVSIHTPVWGDLNFKVWVKFSHCFNNMYVWVTLKLYGPGRKFFGMFPIHTPVWGVTKSK